MGQHLSYGPVIRDRAKIVLKAILDFIDGEIYDEKVKIKTRWQDTCLYVETTVNDLEVLTGQAQSRLSPEHIKRSLKCLVDLNFIEDNRTTLQGSPQWQFTIKLCSQNTTKNLQWFIHEWDKRKPSTSYGVQYNYEKLEADAHRRFAKWKAKDSVGGYHLFERINKFISEHHSGYVIIEGLPGSRKSTLLAEYVTKTRCIPYFMNRHLGLTDAQLFLTKISSQINQMFGLNLDYAQDGLSLYHLLDSVSSKLQDNKKLIIVVDGIDEADAPGQLLGTNTLYLPPFLPDSVFMIVSRQATTTPLYIEQPFEVINLDKFTDNNIEDATQLIKNTFCHLDLDPAHIYQLAVYTQNHWVYLHSLLTDVKKGKCNITDLTHIGDQLQQYYQSHWLKMRLDQNSATKLSILKYIVDQSSPVTLEEIREHSGLEGYRIYNILESWCPLIRCEGETKKVLYDVYHPSFKKYLQLKIPTIVG